MDDMREAVKDIDEISEVARGLLRYRLPCAFIPVLGVDHERRREYGLEW